MSKLKDWGVSPKDAKHAYSSHYDCPHCDQGLNTGERLLVGFSSQILDEDPGEFLYSSFNPDSVLGVFVWRCTKCGSSFWGHASQWRVDHLLLLAKRGVEIEPQAQAELLEAWEEEDAD